MLTVLVADELVQVNLGLLPLAVDALQAGAEDVAVLEADVLGGVEEVAGHGCGWGGRVGW